MGKSEMWEYDLVMNLSKGLASGGGGGGGGAFMMQPGMMQQAQAAAPVAAAEEAKEEEEAAPVEAKKEQTEFDVKLTQIDPEKKVKTIKVCLCIFNIFCPLLHFFLSILIRFSIVTVDVAEAVVLTRALPGVIKCPSQPIHESTVIIVVLLAFFFSLILGKKKNCVNL